MAVFSQASLRVSMAFSTQRNSATGSKGLRTYSWAPRLERGDGGVDAVVSADHDDGGLRRDSRIRRMISRPRHVRQIEIEQYDIDRLPANRPRLPAPPERALSDAPPAAAYQVGESTADHGIVIHHQDVDSVGDAGRLWFACSRLSEICIDCRPALSDSAADGRPRTGPQRREEGGSRTSCLRPARLRQTRCPPIAFTSASEVGSPTPRAASFVPACGRREEPRDLFRRHAGPVVGNGNLHHHLSFVVDMIRGADQDLVAARERLGCIHQQIQQHLLESFFIARDGQYACIQHGRQGDLLLGEQRPLRRGARDPRSCGSPRPDARAAAASVRICRFRRATSPPAPLPDSRSRAPSPGLRRPRRGSSRSGDRSSAPTADSAPRAPAAWSRLASVRSDSPLAAPPGRARRRGRIPATSCGKLPQERQDLGEARRLHGAAAEHQPRPGSGPRRP